MTDLGSTLIHRNCSSKQWSRTISSLALTNRGISRLATRVIVSIELASQQLAKKASKKPEVSRIYSTLQNFYQCATTKNGDVLLAPFVRMIIRIESQWLDILKNSMSKGIYINVDPAECPTSEEKNSSSTIGNIIQTWAQLIIDKWLTNSSWWSKQHENSVTASTTLKGL